MPYKNEEPPSSIVLSTLTTKAMIIEDYEHVDRILWSYHKKSEEAVDISQIKVIYMMFHQILPMEHYYFAVVINQKNIFRNIKEDKIG